MILLQFVNLPTKNNMRIECRFLGFQHQKNKQYVCEYIIYILCHRTSKYPCTTVSIESVVWLQSWSIEINSALRFLLSNGNTEYQRQKLVFPDSSVINMDEQSARQHPAGRIKRRYQPLKLTRCCVKYISENYWVALVGTGVHLRKRNQI